MTPAHPLGAQPRHAEGRPTAPVAHHMRDLPLRVGTRASPLALWQTRHFLALLTGFCPVLKGLNAFEEHQIRTTGDATQAAGTRLADIGGKGLFAKEIHEALSAGRIDFAVHSLKDLETDLPAGIVLACTLAREDARDALILRPGLAAGSGAYPMLPQGARIGTSSVRRQAQLLAVRPDLRCETIRGNVATRLDRVANGDFDATLLAIAGMKRLGLDARADHLLGPETMLPAACQGIVGITVRADNTELRELLSAIEDPAARAVSTAERALLAELDGSCRTPIGGHATLADGMLTLAGLVARADGSFLRREIIRGSPEEAQRIGRELGHRLRAMSPGDLFA